MRVLLGYSYICTYFPLMNGTLQDAPTFFGKEIPYAMCQTIHTYFPRLLLPTYPILFAICSYIWEVTSCYIFAHVYTHLKTILCRTFIEKAIFVLLILILERQFYIICSYFETHFRAIFNIYAHFAKHLATYSTYTCTWWTTFSII